jgi:hypothetical protein
MVSCYLKITLLHYLSIYFNCRIPPSSCSYAGWTHRRRHSGPNNRSSLSGRSAFRQLWKRIFLPSLRWINHRSRCHRYRRPLHRRVRLIDLIDLYFTLISLFVNRTSASQWRIRAGSTFHNSGGQVIQVTRFTQHSAFNSRLDNDISLLFLGALLTLGSGVATITLPAQGATVADGSSAFITGWGTLTVNFRILKPQKS